MARETLAQLSYFPCKFWRFGRNSSYRSMPCTVSISRLPSLRYKIWPIPGCRVNDAARKIVRQYLLRAPLRVVSAASAAISSHSILKAPT